MRKVFHVDTRSMRGNANLCLLLWAATHQSLAIN